MNTVIWIFVVLGMIEVALYSLAVVFVVLALVSQTVRRWIHRSVAEDPHEA